MTRTLALLLALLAPGQRPPNRAPAPAPTRVSVTDFGAKADNGVTDNGPAFQAAVDAVSRDGGGGTVVVPGARQPYYFRTPLFLDRDGVSLEGEGPDVVTLALDGQAGAPAPLVLGIDRVDAGPNGPLAPDLSNRPDAFGVLDQGAAPARGQRWGFRTNNNAYLQFQATPFTLGSKGAGGGSDHWGDSAAFTLEVCFAPAGDRFRPAMPILGAGSVDPIAPAPFLLRTWDDPRTLILFFNSSTLATGYHVVGFRLGDAKPPYRVAVSVDLAAKRAYAAVNGRTVALVPAAVNGLTAVGADGTIDPAVGPRFAPNRFEPLMVGTAGVLGPQGNAPAGFDGAFYGLRVSRVARYRDASGAQVRADTGRPPDDLWSYFGNDKDTVAFLPFDDPPSASRVVPVQNGDATYQFRTGGLILHTVTPQPVTGAAVRGLTVRGRNYGYAVAVGAAQSLYLERLATDDAAYGVGSFVRRDSYVVRLRGANLRGYESGYFGYRQIVRADDVTFGTPGRETVLLVGCSSAWSDVLIGGGAAANSLRSYAFLAGGYGGTNEVVRSMTDFANEGQGFGAGGAAVYAEGEVDVPRTTLRLRDCGFNALGDAPLLDLRSGASGVRPCLVVADGVGAWTAKPALVRVDGPLWAGTVSVAGPGGAAVTSSGRFGAGVNVRAAGGGEVAPRGP